MGRREHSNQALAVPELHFPSHFQAVLKYTGRTTSIRDVPTADHSNICPLQRGYEQNSWICINIALITNGLGEDSILILSTSWSIYLQSSEKLLRLLNTAALMNRAELPQCHRLGPCCFPWDHPLAITSTYRAIQTEGTSHSLEQRHSISDEHVKSHFFWLL